MPTMNFRSCTVGNVQRVAGECMARQIKIRSTEKMSNTVLIAMNDHKANW